jgi:hypothetical protein
VITPFTLRDVRLLEHLQKSSVSLCPIESLTCPRSPLWSALISILPFDDGQTLTFVLNEERRDGRKLRGFIQARQPHGRPSIYVQSLTPRLDLDEDAHAVWARLTSHLVAAAGELGVQRVFACAIEGSQELETLLALGFSAYTREEIYRLQPDTYPQATTKGHVRPEQSADLWQIGRLYRTVTPHLVQQAECPAQNTDLEWLGEPMTWSQGEGFVLEDEDGIAGYGHLMSGRIGHWMHLLVHPRARDRVSELLDYGLALLNYYPPYPVYCVAREYQDGTRELLQERGFELFVLQCRLVKHTTARVKEPALGLVPALEKRVEAPTTTASSTEGP